MIENIFDIISRIFDYLLDLKIIDIPLHIAYFGVTIGLAYCVATIVVSFPCSLWEAITKKKLNDDKQDKVIHIFTVLFAIIMLMVLLNELAIKNN